MAKTKRQIIEDLKLIDVIVEILDARIPLSSQNPDIKRNTNGKKKVVMLNKADLADEKETNRWVKYFENQGIPAIVTDANSGRGVSEVIKAVRKISRDEQEKYANKGRIGKSIRIMIVGIPNVGKSSFINRIAKKNSAQVGNKPGVTRQKQWIRVDDGIELMDTPGVLWPKFESEEVGLHLAYTGTIKDDILEKTEIAFKLTDFLMDNYLDNMLVRYKLDETAINKIMNSNIERNDKILEVLNVIAKKRGAILSGARMDYEKISGIILDEFRSGKLGKITIEKAKTK